MVGSLGVPELLFTCGMWIANAIAIAVAVVVIQSMARRFTVSRRHPTACPSCGGTIPELSAYCNHCGASVAGDGE